jgi:hypothetical protein
MHEKMIATGNLVPATDKNNGLSQVNNTTDGQERQLSLLNKN